MALHSVKGGYLTVLYANEEGSAFDMNYYLSTHMPLCGKIWGPHGLQSWQVIQFITHADGSAPPYKVQAILYRDNLESLNNILRGKSKPIFDDVCCRRMQVNSCSVCTLKIAPIDFSVKQRLCMQIFYSLCPTSP